MCPVYIFLSEPFERKWCARCPIFPKYLREGLRETRTLSPCCSAASTEGHDWWNITTVSNPFTNHHLCCHVVWSKRGQASHTCLSLSV